MADLLRAATWAHAASVFAITIAFIVAATARAAVAAILGRIAAAAVAQWWLCWVPFAIYSRLSCTILYTPICHLHWCYEYTPTPSATAL